MILERDALKWVKPAKRKYLLIPHDDIGETIKVGDFLRYEIKGG